jgi:hypothetical protein
VRAPPGELRGRGEHGGRGTKTRAPVDAAASPRPTPTTHPPQAEEFAEEDKAVKEKVDARNGLESYAYNVKTQLEDEEKGIAGKVDADDKETLQKAVQAALDWLDENTSADAEEYKEQQKKVRPRWRVAGERGEGAPPLVARTPLSRAGQATLTAHHHARPSPPPPILPPTAAGEGRQPDHVQGVRQVGRRARRRPRRRARRRRR